MTYKEALERLENGQFFDPEKDRDILKLADESGWTVAHWQAWAGYMFNPQRHAKILELATKGASVVTVAKVMADRGYIFTPVRDGQLSRLAIWQVHVHALGFRQK